MGLFELHAPFKPTGDQPQAIKELVSRVRGGTQHQTLLGVTGSGKTFTMANTIAQLDRPTLVFSHNKTLAAQLYGELMGFFPKNAVEFYISYYDYYQPEAFIPSTNTYIEKDTSINEEIERLRLRATSSLLSRRDVIVVASVSAIYGVGNPETFKQSVVALSVGLEIERDVLLSQLVSIQYNRDDHDYAFGSFRARGDTVEIRSAYDERVLRVEFFGDEIESLRWVEPMTGRSIEEVKGAVIYPATQFVTSKEGVGPIIDSIDRDLEIRLGEMDELGLPLEAHRLASRTRYDLEMIRELGHCAGVENYSRYFDNRNEGERPACLLDYFPEDYLMFIDESHATIPQIGAMYHGDRSRKENLVQHGFRLPSALDNRPLRFREFEEIMPTTVFISATPADYELEKCGGVVVEQVIRPTGLLDPPVTVLPVGNQVDDLLEKIRVVTARGERVLVTTLTKKMSEDLSEYLSAAGVKVTYLHSDIASLDRIEILRKLRLGESDVLVGVNLLREGLDLPEVSLVAILDADREGFLRSARSLIQTSGRAARNANGEVIMYADKITRSMKIAIDETNRRRKRQLAYNEKHGIVPKTIIKSTDDILQATYAAGDLEAAEPFGKESKPWEKFVDQNMSPQEMVSFLQEAMEAAAKATNFEEAAALRDRIEDLKAQWGVGQD
jgi:excinuclease ABC subunit B